MVNNILNAITQQLYATFGNSYRYYVETVKQDLTKPCFTVDVLEPSERSKSPVLYDRVMPIVVHYFNDNLETIKKDSYGIAEQLVECLEYLPFQNTTLRGEDISWQMVEDVLECFIVYRFETIKSTTENDNMEILLPSKISTI